MIITIGGLAGSGKSTVSRLLAKNLNLPRYSIGDLRRQKAKKQGMTLTEYNQLGEIDPSTDVNIDNYQKNLGKTQNNFIIEGRNSWYFIPQSFKIYLTVSPEIGAKRIWQNLQKNNQRNEGKDLKTIADVSKSVQARLLSDKKRYKKYFGIDAYNPKNYDLVINTDKIVPEEVVKIILKAIKTKNN